MVSSDQLLNAIKRETRAGIGEFTREQLDGLVPPGYCWRLVEVSIIVLQPD